MCRQSRVCVLASAVVAVAGCATPSPDAGSPRAHESARFYPLSEITRDNVASLEPAWTYHTDDFSGGRGPEPTGTVPGVQVRPVIADGVLYVSTPSSIVIALDGDTGEEVWRHDPQESAARRCYQPHRGVALWEPTAREAAEPGRVVYSGTCDGRLLALDAATGEPWATFGEGGVLNLRPGVDAREGEAYTMTSPPAVYRDVVVVGAMAPEGVPRGPAGDVRGFDARTGREVWRFRTVPQPGEFGHDTWPEDGWQRRTGVNVWSSMAVDVERGLVFLPIGSPSYDFYGGDRHGQNLFGNALVALDAATGERRWHQQLVHHDLWDFDPPAQPILTDIPRDGGVVPAVIQVTKMGLVFVFDRETGEPVFGLEERPVPQSEVPGEATWPTQPFPVKPAPLARTTPITADDLTTVTPESRAECEAIFSQVQTSGGLYQPAGLDVTLWFPGTMGGATWSGGTVDPTRAYLVVNTNEVGAIGLMAPTGSDRSPSSPSGSSPDVPIAPPTTSGPSALLPEERQVLPYARSGPFGSYGRFWDSRQLPCQQPPWGQLNAVDLSTGDIAWQVPLGNAPQLAELGITGTGTPNLGGAITTAGGLVFIGGAIDSRFRAFDVETGRELWQAELPAPGHATPITYRGTKTGRQFVVIAAGGGGRFTHRISDAIVAFALPQ